MVLEARSLRAWHQHKVRASGCMRTWWRISHNKTGQMCCPRSLSLFLHSSYCYHGGPTLMTSSDPDYLSHVHLYIRCMNLEIKLPTHELLGTHSNHSINHITRSLWGPPRTGVEHLPPSYLLERQGHRRASIYHLSSLASASTPLPEHRYQEC
jgi:hypothetical protein